ncbi:hypothetical protein AYI82_06330 [Shewanella algae]|uniref:hypothetical protein n=1 Tax=Shewanella algae TaxID=38313 RepID=UPI001183CB01|nr:hypothetical protein [Shewanella algae]TVL10632.1 hypothetical protein AYI82_06330 [Shewanella algae]
MIDMSKALETAVDSEKGLDAFANGVPLTTSELIAIAGSQMDTKNRRDRLMAQGLGDVEIEQRLANEVNQALEKVKSGEFVPAARCYGNRDTIKGD